jgi:hypothetical protein
LGIKDLILGKKKQDQTNDIEALKQKFASVSNKNNVNPTNSNSEMNNNNNNNNNPTNNIISENNNTNQPQQATQNPTQLNVTEVVGDESKTEAIDLNQNAEEEKKINDDYLEKVILEQDKGEAKETSELKKEREISKKSIAKYLEEIKENHEETKLINLVIQQIKELIEIDNQLSKKIDEVQKAVSREIAEREKIVKTVDKHYKETKKIEKNMEKFVGLYEAVTNNFNPFVEEKTQTNQDEQNIMDFSKRNTAVVSPENVIKKLNNSDDDTESIENNKEEKDESYAQNLFQQLKKEKDQGTTNTSTEDLEFEGDDDEESENKEKETDAKSLFAKLKAEKETTKSKEEEPKVEKKEEKKDIEVTEMKNPEVKQTKVLPEHLHFRLKSGKSISSLSGLVEFLTESSEEEFNEYVTHYKNDFSGWIYHTFHNEKLSQKLSEAKTKDAMIEVLKKEINDN